MLKRIIAPLALLALSLGLLFAVLDANATGITSRAGGTGSTITSLTPPGRIQFVWMVSPGNSVYDLITGGGFAPTGYGSGTKAPASLATNGAISFGLSATASTTDGMITSATVVQPGYLPSVAVNVKIQSITNVLHFVSMDNNAGSCGPGSGVGNFTAAASYACATNQHAAIVQDTRSASPAALWCCSGDGTNGSCITTGITAVAGTNYILRMDLSTTAFTCSVNGTAVSKSTNLPTVPLKVNIGAMAISTTNPTGPIFGGLKLETGW